MMIESECGRKHNAMVFQSQQERGLHTGFAPDLPPRVRLSSLARLAGGRCHRWRRSRSRHLRTWPVTHVSTTFPFQEYHPDIQGRDVLIIGANVDSRITVVTFHVEMSARKRTHSGPPDYDDLDRVVVQKSKVANDLFSMSADRGEGDSLVFRQFAFHDAYYPPC